MPIIEHICCGF